MKLSQSTHSARQVVYFRPPAPSCQAGGEPTLSHPRPPLQYQGWQRSRVEEGELKLQGGHPGGRPSSVDTRCPGHVGPSSTPFSPSSICSPLRLRSLVRAGSWSAPSARVGHASCWEPDPPATISPPRLHSLHSGEVPRPPGPLLLHPRSLCLHSTTP